MTRVLVVWEDRYFETLSPFIKEQVAVRAPAGVVVYPKLLFHTAYGAGGFKHYVSVTWPLARAKGTPSDPGVIDHLVCVVDGDKLHEQVSAIPQAPAQVDAVEAWLAKAESDWQEHLRSFSEKAPASTVHGLILCWNKESLVLAAYDRDAAKRPLGIDVQASGAQRFLAACKPPPASVRDELFSSTFRKPLNCLAELGKASASTTDLGKNAPAFDDTLKVLTRDDRAVVARRVPDLGRLADLIWRLASPGAASASASEPTSASAGAGARAPKAKAPRRASGAGSAEKVPPGRAPKPSASKPSTAKKRR